MVFNCLTFVQIVVEISHVVPKLLLEYRRTDWSETNGSLSFVLDRDKKYNLCVYDVMQCGVNKYKSAILFNVNSSYYQTQRRLINLFIPTCFELTRPSLGPATVCKLAIL